CVNAGRTANGAEYHDSAAERPEDPGEKEQLGYALARPARADLVTVAHLREQVRRLDEQYDRSPAAALIAGTGSAWGRSAFSARMRVARMYGAICAPQKL